MRRVLIALSPLFLAVVLLLPQLCFIVDERNQVIITQFGEYRRSIQDPGLYFKIPFIQMVHRFEKRILSSDAAPAEYLTLDKKRVVVDHVTRWRIVDPLKFYKTVRDVYGARSRLDDVVFSELRRAIAEREFANIISSKREAVMELVAKSAATQAIQFGIIVEDVRIKRADLPPEVQQSVFSRMVAERERIAKRYRSEGEEEAAKIRAQTDKERTIILAGAYEQSQILSGEGEAEATRITAEAFGQDEEFFAFIRSLNAYEVVLSEEDSMLLSAESPFLRYLNRSR